MLFPVLILEYIVTRHNARFQPKKIPTSINKIVCSQLNFKYGTDTTHATHIARVITALCIKATKWKQVSINSELRFKRDKFPRAHNI